MGSIHFIHLILVQNIEGRQIKNVDSNFICYPRIAKHVATKQVKAHG